MENSKKTRDKTSSEILGGIIITIGQSITIYFVIWTLMLFSNAGIYAGLTLATLRFMFWMHNSLAPTKAIGQCSKCKEPIFNTLDIYVRSKTLSHQIVPDTYTDSKGKVKTKHYEMGQEEDFYKCKKCGHEWSETQSYKRLT